MDIRVAIVEDDSGVRDNLACLINQSAGFKCVSSHPTAENALEALPKSVPDVVLMDINLPGMSGIECVWKVKSLLPKTQIIMLTVYENTDHIFTALAAGATGYLLKQTPPNELLEAIRNVHAGGSPMTSHIARLVVASFRQNGSPGRETETLTAREQQVLTHLAKGYLYKEIADLLGIRYDTVHAHVRNIYEKLHVRSRGQAVAKHLAQQAGARG